MAHIVNMPRLSDTMTEGVVAKWLKKVGDTVSEGDILAEIETDKATMEFESFHEGVLLHIGLQEGQTAPVDSLLAIIGEKGEDISNLITTDANVPNTEEPLSPEKPKQESIPDDIKVVTMPRLSDTMTEGTVVSWLKKVGDTVSEGDILAEIETDKATMEFESFYQGTLLHIGLKEGQMAPVDSLLAIIGKKGTDVTAVVGGFKNDNKIAQPPPVNTEKIADNAPSQKEIKKDKAPVIKKISAVSSENTRVIASPLAKRLATEKGINLARVTGTGEGGRIVKTDVENFTYPSESSSPSFENKNVSVVTKQVNNSQMRKIIAKRLGESKFSAPHYYLGMDINMDNAISFRKQINDLPETKISFNDIVVKACAMALKLHPQINTQWTLEKTIYNEHISIGIAVAVEDGLLVPVVPFTDTKTLTQIGAEIKDKAIKAKNKKLTPEQMEGSTFTISNLGMFGITEFTSIINQPNSAILSVGGITQQPIVKDGNIVVGNIMKVTLACDHRTIDGATGAAFLNTFKQFIENPVTMLAKR